MYFTDKSVLKVVIVVVIWSVVHILLYRGLWFRKGVINWMDTSINFITMKEQVENPASILQWKVMEDSTLEAFFVAEIDIFYMLRRKEWEW